MVLVCWQNASRGEQKQFEAISTFLKHSPQLLDFLFDPKVAKLNDSPDRLLLAASGGIEVHEIFDAEPEVFAQIMKGPSRT